MTASPACLSRQVGDFLPPAGGVPPRGTCLLCRCGKLNGGLAFFVARLPCL